MKRLATLLRKIDTCFPPKSLRLLPPKLKGLVLSAISPSGPRLMIHFYKSIIPSNIPNIDYKL